MYHFQVDTSRHAQTSKPGFGQNISAGFSQKLSDPDTQSLLVSEFGFLFQDTADMYSILQDLAYYPAARNDRTM
jgi:hypothetical protein